MLNAGNPRGPRPLEWIAVGGNHSACPSSRSGWICKPSMQVALRRCWLETTLGLTACGVSPDIERHRAPNIFWVHSKCERHTSRESCLELAGSIVSTSKDVIAKLCVYSQCFKLPIGVGRFVLGRDHDDHHVLLKFPRRDRQASLSTHSLPPKPRYLLPDPPPIEPPLIPLSIKAHGVAVYGVHGDGWIDDLFFSPCPAICCWAYAG